MKKIKTLHIILFFSLLISCSAYAHWTTKGPYGGRITCMTSSDTLVYIGTRDGGVYRSTNSNVTSWRYANYTGLSNGSINALVCIGGKVIAGCNSGIFRSKDIGNTWTQQNTGLLNTKVHCLLKLNGLIYAGTESGIALSTDSAATWNITGMTSNTVTCLAVSGNTLYAGTKTAGVFQSTNFGNTWTPINNNLSDLNILSLCVNGNDLVVATLSGVFSTNTSTNNWINFNSGLNTAQVNFVYASGATMFAATTQGAYQLSGSTWMAGNTGFSDTLNTLLIFNNKFYAGTNNEGVVRSTSTLSINWTKLNTGLNNVKVNAIYNSGQLVIAATNQGLFVSTDLAANYFARNNGISDSLNITSIAFAGTKLFAGTNSAGIFCSADTGKTWVQVNSGLNNLSIKKMVIHANNVVAATSTGEIFYSTVNSVNWIMASALPAGIQITSLASDGMICVLGSSAHGVFVSTTLSNWSQSNSGLGNTNVSSVAIHHNEIYAGTNGDGIFKTSTANINWASVNTGLPSLTITALFAGPQQIVAGYKGGIHVSNDQGANWEPTNVLLYIPEFSDVNDISFSASSTRIFIGTPCNSLYSNSTNELPVAIKENMEKENYFSVYPNPSAGKIFIATKENNNSIKIKLYDAEGRILLEELTTKDHIQINRPGIYFLELQMEEKRTVQKIVIQ